MPRRSVMTLRFVMPFRSVMLLRSLMASETMFLRHHAIT
jgi:hypothetical protein